MQRTLSITIRLVRIGRDQYFDTEQHTHAAPCEAYNGPKDPENRFLPYVRDTGALLDGPGNSASSES
jgi:hypothetical protein